MTLILKIVKKYLQNKISYSNSKISKRICNNTSITQTPSETIKCIENPSPTYSLTTYLLVQNSKFIKLSKYFKNIML